MNENELTSGPLNPMDTQYIQRLVTLENKLDYLIEQSRSTTANHKGVEARVDALENKQQWVIGASAALLFVSGALGLSVRLQVKDLIHEETRDINFLDEVCRDIRATPKPSTYLYPESCKL